MSYIQSYTEIKNDANKLVLEAQVNPALLKPISSEDIDFEINYDDAPSQYEMAFVEDSWFEGGEKEAKPSQGLAIQLSNNRLMQVDSLPFKPP